MKLNQAHWQEDPREQLGSDMMRDIDRAYENYQVHAPVWTNLIMARRQFVIAFCRDAKLRELLKDQDAISELGDYLDEVHASIERPGRAP